MKGAMRMLVWDKVIVTPIHEMSVFFSLFFR